MMLYVLIDLLNILVELLKCLDIKRTVYPIVKLLYTIFIPRVFPHMRDIEIVIVLKGIECFLEFFRGI